MSLFDADCAASSTRHGSGWLGGTLGNVVERETISTRGFPAAGLGRRFINVGKMFHVFPIAG